MTEFNNEFSKEVWNNKYRWGDEKTVDDTFDRVAKALSDDQAPVTPEEARQIIGIEEPSPIFDSKGDTQAS